MRKIIISAIALFLNAATGGIAAQAESTGKCYLLYDRFGNQALFDTCGVQRPLPLPLTEELRTCLVKSLGIEEKTPLPHHGETMISHILDRCDVPEYDVADAIEYIRIGLATR